MCGRLVFRWLAIPWLQAELDAWMRRFNSSPRRADKHKILPQGIPDLIDAKPHLFNSKNFKVALVSSLYTVISLTNLSTKPDQCIECII